MTDVICESCGHHNQVGSRFCSSCGERIERQPDEPATITFSLDPEADEQISVELPEPSSGGMLVVTRGPNTGAEFVLEHVITSAGRHPDSDIFLDDVTVSRRHVELERTGAGSVIVRDVGSLNGTYLNGDRIDGERPITTGDELQVGKFKLVYVAGEAS